MPSKLSSLLHRMRLDLGLTQTCSTLEKIGRHGADVFYSGELGTPPAPSREDHIL